jgi:hypothetical protein
VTLPPFVPSLPDGILWAKLSQDYSSSETGSSIFDFNGDGASEVVYRDECYMRVYDGSSGSVLFSAPASSGTGQEYPVVADVSGTFTTQIVAPRAANGGNCPSPEDDRLRHPARSHGPLGLLAPHLEPARLLGHERRR